MDLHQEISDRLGGYINSTKFTDTLDKMVQDAVNDAVKSMFGYGDLREVIREGLKEKVRIDLNQIDFAPMNQIVTDLVKNKCHAAFKAPMLEKLAAELDDMFQPAPKEITLQELVDMWKEPIADECACDGVDAILVEIERGDYDRKGSGTLKIWDGGKKTDKGYGYSSSERMIDPDLHMYVHDDGRIALIHDVTTDNARNSLATNVSGREAKIFMMYCAGTVITDFAKTLDTDNLDTSTSRN